MSSISGNERKKRHVIQPIDIEKFSKTISKFQKIEDARDQLWDRARTLIRDGYEVEAYILILATWNFARFRYFMKEFNLDEFRSVIKKINPIFRRLESKSFIDINYKDKSLITDIKYIYESLKDIAEQTGASKIMALKNPKLFIMWDTEIRRIYHIDNIAKPHHYIEFLMKMRDIFGGLEWNETKSKKDFAKAIDEYNYVIADNNRRKRKNN